MQPSLAPEASQPKLPGQAPQVRRFLVVDDHPVNRLLVRQVLTREWPTSQVLEATQGAEALQCIEQGPPFDLVLMDMVMPVMDGIEATSRIKGNARQEVRQTPVLGLTANVSTADLERFQEAGLAGLLLKPFEVERLRAEVARIVAMRNI